jgi:hypothetical protein
MPNWIAKGFTVESQSNETRRFGLTLALEGSRWTATDPRGIINPDEGVWQSNNINTDCLAAAIGPRVVLLIGCGMINVTLGQSGVAEVHQAGSETFTWTCDRVVNA